MAYVALLGIVIRFESLHLATDASTNQRYSNIDSAIRLVVNIHPPLQRLQNFRLNLPI